MSHYCPQCNVILKDDDLRHTADGKALGLLTGLAIGAAGKNPWLALGLAAVGTQIGHLVDEELAPRCPECAAVLKAIGRSYLGGL